MTKEEIRRRQAKAASTRAALLKGAIVAITLTAAAGWAFIALNR